MRAEGKIFGHSLPLSPHVPLITQGLASVPLGLTPPHSCVLPASSLSSMGLGSLSDPNRRVYLLQKCHVDTVNQPGSQGLCPSFSLSFNHFCLT